VTVPAEARRPGVAVSAVPSRSRRALVLLADGRGTTRAAHACGWADPSGLVAAFTAVIGTTPGRCRTGRGTTARAARPSTAVTPSG
jgi:AraC-like DNA-binding protein